MQTNRGFGGFIAILVLTAIIAVLFIFLARNLLLARSSTATDSGLSPIRAAEEARRLIEERGTGQNLNY